MLLHLLDAPEELLDEDSVVRPTLLRLARQLFRIANGELPGEVLGIKDRRRLRRPLEAVEAARIILFAHYASIRRDQPGLFEAEKRDGSWEDRVTEATARRAREAVERALESTRNLGDLNAALLVQETVKSDLVRWARLVLRDRSRIPNSK
jgi:hypothetical protein